MKSEISKLKNIDEEQFLENFPTRYVSYLTEIQKGDYSVLVEIYAWVRSKQAASWSKTAKKFLTDLKFFDKKPKTRPDRRGKTIQALKVERGKVKTAKAKAADQKEAKAINCYKAAKSRYKLKKDRMRLT